jgi:hypothetical protein
MCDVHPECDEVFTITLCGHRMEWLHNALQLQLDDLRKVTNSETRTWGEAFSQSELRLDQHVPESHKHHLDEPIAPFWRENFDQVSELRARLVEIAGRDMTVNG